MLLALVGPAHVAFADDKPTPEQMEQAKKAFADGKTLFEQNKLKEAVEKFKESYRLSKNPLLLYNIGFTLDQMGNKPLAKIYYDKFLADAPKEAQQRAEVTDRVKQLDKEIAEQDLNGTTPDPTTTPDPNATKPPPTDTHKDVKIKPPGTYKADDFQHQVVTEAPPGKPLDLSAFVPEDSGFTVTMYFRDAGEPSFTSKQMKWRYKELVARIPAGKMAGSAIQYYIEVKDTTGNVVTRSGKSTSPNLVDIDVAAPPRFYPDLSDDTATTATQTHPVDDNPLNPQQPRPLEQPTQPQQPETPGDGFTDVGSKKFTYTKWGFTGAAGLFLATSIVFYVQAGQQATALKSDASTDESTGKPCTEPCHAFDGYDRDLQNAGQRDQTLSRVMVGLGVVSAGVAGYYWYKQFKKHGGGGTPKATEPQQPQQQPPAAPVHDENAWIIVPAVGDHYTGAAATVRF